jgi:hypothetical protein
MTTVTRQPRLSLPVALVLAVAIHVDWHLARHHGRLSAAWPYHWVLALPVFGLAGWYVARRWADGLALVSVTTLGLAVLLAQVLEPLGEYAFFHWPLHEGFGPQRLQAFGLFLIVGLVAYVAAALAARRGADAPAPRRTLPSPGRDAG